MPEIPIFENLETPRLKVRRLQPEDAAALSVYRSRPEVSLYQGWGDNYDEAQALKLIQNMQDRNPGQPGWFQFALQEKETGALLGDLGFHVFEPLQAEVGFTLDSRVWGKGYATEGLKAVLDYAFHVLFFHRITASTDPRNVPSQKVLLRLGFRHEGHHLESYSDGENWLDEDRFALLRREWREQ
ncbi:GNAT family N-acetyltransferase [Deinococcus roseus]|uniref:Ribosomal-protein-serine acetyltransferase n=1 Tax=Deinococcus roseus TaxID=392414 RepID=A0ABQ2D0H4_9DEIO|nr:GNAT family N-acetyltransferase [Deinococcus roseus]GGJ35475.1 ribosomal-protein-serine acetyltransferase [Deinococcus roseus]